ncbi:MAG: hypothetical protein V1809_14375 [Planctomycetota bacterium]
MRAMSWGMALGFLVLSGVARAGEGSASLRMPPLSAGEAKLLIYPPPEDLTGVEHLSRSRLYSVKINGKPSFVYHTDNYASAHRRGEESASFVYFSFAGGPVTVEVTSHVPVTSVKIRPGAFGITPVVKGDRITFTLAEPRKLSVEVNDRKNPLFILADEPDVPNPGATHYFGPGVHHIGLEFKLKSRETVYIAGGAVVEGTFLIDDEATGVEIRGRGILCGGEWSFDEFWRGIQAEEGVPIPKKSEKWGRPSMIRCPMGRHPHGTVVEGICLVNSPGWVVPICGGDRRVCRNLKIVCWNGCTDGPWCHGDHGVLENCFIFNNDDCLHLISGSHWVVRDNVIWGGYWGYPIVNRNFGFTGPQEDVLVENTYVLGGRLETIKIAEWEPTGKIVKKDFTFRNLHVEDYSTDVFLLVATKNMSLRNIVFENVVIDKRMRIVIKASKDGPIDGVRFVNLTMNGKRITTGSGDIILISPLLSLAPANSRVRFSNKYYVPGIRAFF